MRRLLFSLCLALPFAAAMAATQAPVLAPLPYEKTATLITAGLVGRYHYRPQTIDDALSQRVFDRYLKALDADRFFLLSEDVDRWAAYRDQIDDAIRSGDLAIPFAMFNLYLRRAAERFDYALKALAEEPDFKRNESYRAAREDAPWLKSTAEAEDLWRRRVKNDWLQLKLAGKADTAIRDTLRKRYERLSRRVAQMRSDDAFQIFMNAFTTSIEPHTAYSGPRQSENFDISMRLSMVGIGAVLEEKDEYPTIRELVSGGPAALSGRLAVGDRIASVAQGNDGAPVDVVGGRLDETVALIRGEPDTTVRLGVLPADAAPDSALRTVTLVRKKITLESQAAKQSILTVGSGTAAKRIGVITLPGFYEDFAARRRGERDFRSATRDVEKLLARLKEEKVDGVVIDLRNNGGGALTEAVDLTGLFIDTGPVVQQRNARGRITVGEDTQRGTAWDGPLGVLINRASASASEIFAAAIQDYGRGVIIGENSFGKGTVQSQINYAEVAGRKDEQLGDLRLTIAQFYRIDGGTTQLRGVVPDITLPSATDRNRIGESSYENPLPWEQIRAVDHDRRNGFSSIVAEVAARHEARVANDTEYRNFAARVGEVIALRARKEVSLNFAERMKDKTALDARLKALKSSSEEVAAATDDEDEEGTAKDRPANAAPTNAAPTNTAPANGAQAKAAPVKDVWLNEAAAIVADEAAALAGATAMPASPTLH
jgi:carboxyl-terminal processing protease